MSIEETKKIAIELLACCREGREQEGLKTLYADDAVSVEAMASPGTDSPVSAGRSAIKDKHAWWDENFEVHEAAVEGPFYHGEDRFGLIFEVDATNKMDKQRNKMKELAIYTVKDGKITREEFFYDVS